ncbi:MAG: Rieske 2Fe-2S domain-containing protein [Bacteroidetes bacterium]|nr:Rieske 2Fe-2S domain-containing protein [Bacteroidota bacterium]
MKRNEFTKNVCSAFALSLVGLPLLQACTKDTETLYKDDADPELTSKGIKSVDNQVIISIEHPNFSALKTPGNFINSLEFGFLILRKTEDSVIAVSNCCPHQGSRNQWRYIGDKFLCTNHGNSFNTGTGNEASCNSNRTSGNLKQYPASLVDTLITIEMSV